MSSESPPSNASPPKPDDEGASAASAEPSGGAAEAHADSSDSDVIELDEELDSVRPPPPPSLRPKSESPAKKEPLGLTATAKLPAPAWPPRVVADLMTRKIITVGQDEPIGNLEGGMQHFGFHHLPVVGSDMKLVGLISLIDLLHAKLGATPDGKPAPTVDATTTARTIMRKNVVIARLDSPLSAACQVLLQKKLTCLPVALEDGTLVGIITQRDFLKLALALLENKA